MFSAVMSAFFNSSLTISNPFGDFRLIAIDFLLALNWRKYQGSSSDLPGRSRRPGSPRPGFSIFTTSAPNHASTSVQVVPASNWVKSTTLTPFRNSKSCVMPLITFPPPLNEFSDGQPAPSRAPPQCLPPPPTVNQTVETTDVSEDVTIERKRLFFCLTMAIWNLCR